MKIAILFSERLFSFPDRSFYLQEIVKLGYEPVVFVKSGEERIQIRSLELQKCTVCDLDELDRNNFQGTKNVIIDDDAGTLVSLFGAVPHVLVSSNISNWWGVYDYIWCEVR